MKMIFVAPRFHTNQTELVRKLKQEGHETIFHVCLIGKTEDHSLIVPKLFLPCALSRIIMRFFGEGGVNTPRSFPNPFLYFHELRKIQPNLIVIRDPNRWFSIVAAISARLLDIKILFYTQGELHRKYTCIRRIKTFLLLKIFDAAWFTPVKGDSQEHPYYPPKCYFIPFPVRICKTKTVSRNIPLRILMVGKFESRKNHLLLLEALNLLSDLDFSLTLVGECSSDSHEMQKLKIIEAITSFGLEGKVFILTNVPFPQMWNLYSSHDLFVLPSRNEPASISVLEAYANGLLAICSTTCGTRSYISNGQNGYVFKCGDLEDLASKIRISITELCGIKTNRLRIQEFGYKSVSADVFYTAFVCMLRDRWKTDSL
jgi:glycosyltransferase involved in cell wall biosynthesis